MLKWFIGIMVFLFIMSSILNKKDETVVRQKYKLVITNDSASCVATDSLYEPVDQVLFESDAACSLSPAYAAFYKKKNDDLEILKKKKVTELPLLLKKLRKQTDKIEKTSFYISPGLEYNYPINLYIGELASKSVFLRCAFSYTGSDWIFFDKVIISIDGENTELEIKEYDKKTDNGGGSVYESIDLLFDDNIALIERIIKSKTTYIRLSGKHNRKDYLIGKNQKNSLKTVIESYYLLSI